MKEKMERILKKVIEKEIRNVGIIIEGRNEL
jgi:hypothetical protein